MAYVPMEKQVKFVAYKLKIDFFQLIITDPLQSIWGIWNLFGYCAALAVYFFMFRGYISMFY